MPRPNRRFAVEEVDNGWLVKLTEAGSDRLLARYVFSYLGELMEFLHAELGKGADDAKT